MELKEFIKIAITDITDAISELQSELDNGSIINPTLLRGEYDKHVIVDENIKGIERLNFDVAVTASSSKGIDGKATAGISIFGAKVGVENTDRTENASRITFSIPIVFPTSNLKKPK